MCYGVKSGCCCPKVNGFVNKHQTQSIYAESDELVLNERIGGRFSLLMSICRHDFTSLGLKDDMIIHYQYFKGKILKKKKKEKRKNQQRLRKKCLLHMVERTLFVS